MMGPGICECNLFLVFSIPRCVWILSVLGTVLQPLRASDSSLSATRAAKLHRGLISPMGEDQQNDYEWARMWRGPVS